MQLRLYTLQDQSYVLPSSPNDLRVRLSEALARVESLEREKSNVKDRERRAKNTVCGLLEDLRAKKIINEELKERLDLYSAKMKIIYFGEHFNLSVSYFPIFVKTS